MLGLLAAPLAQDAAYAWPPVTTYSPQEIDLTRAPRSWAQHNAIYRQADWPITFQRELGSGAVLLIGLQHTNDPADPQIARLRELWESFKPTRSFIEGRMKFGGGTWDTATRRFGEAGATSWLSRRDEVERYSWEPDFKSYAGNLAQQFGSKPVATFLFLSVYFGERGEGMDDRRAESLMRGRLNDAGLAGALKGLDDVDRVWGSPDWRTASPNLLSPNGNGSIWGRIAALSVEIRGRHMVRCLADSVRQGHRVICVAGGSHAIRQERVLAAAL